MAVALHLRMLPFLLWRLLKGDVPNSDPIELLVILARMLEYIMADRLSTTDIEDFEDQVIEYFAKRKICVDQYSHFCNMTPKNHHIGMAVTDLVTFFFKCFGSEIIYYGCSTVFQN